MAATLDSIAESIVEFRAELKALTKMVRKVKATQEDPTGEKAKARSANNIFNRPFVPSEELREFMGLQEGETTTRSTVTKFVNKYVVENNLKDPEVKKVIVLDEKLKQLLNPPEGVQLTSLTIQTYLIKHYPKKENKDEKPKEPKEPKAEKPKAVEKPKAATGTAAVAGAKKKLEPESSATSAAEEPAAKKKKIVVSSAAKGKAVVA